jgi:hypothetical protein
MSPSTPAASALSAHLRSVTSWYTRPPCACTCSTTQRGLPSTVVKKRIPSSSAILTHRSMLPRSTRVDFSTMALKPMGLSVRERIRRMPARSSWPWAYTIDSGWTTPMPPAADTAATSSGLEHGYMAPPMIGTSMPSSLVRAVCRIDIGSRSQHLVTLGATRKPQLTVQSRTAPERRAERQAEPRQPAARHDTQSSCHARLCLLPTKDDASRAGPGGSPADRPAVRRFGDLGDKA